MLSQGLVSKIIETEGAINLQQLKHTFSRYASIYPHSMHHFTPVSHLSSMAHVNKQKAPGSHAWSRLCAIGDVTKSMLLQHSTHAICGTCGFKTIKQNAAHDLLSL